MNILITVDDNYIDVATKMLYSLKLYNNRLIIHVIYDNLSSSSIYMLKEFIKENNIGELKLYKFDSSKFNLQVVMTKYITKTCYFRLYSPYIIKDVDRLLYLDPDIVCQGSIEELYNTDLGKDILGGCPNMLRAGYEEYRRKMLRTIDLPPYAEYINSGVLLIDMKKFRDFISQEELTKFLEEKSSLYEFQDQDTINKVFYNKIKILDNNYNYQINATDRWKTDIKKTLIHYSEIKKPWKNDYDDTYKAIPYYKLLHIMGKDNELKQLIYNHGLSNAAMILDYILSEKY